MADRGAALEAHRDAVRAFLTAARAVSPAGWDRPRAEGKWSAAQVADHIALAYEAGCEALEGRSTGPAPPRLLRPVIRTLLLRPVLMLGRFPMRSKSPSALQPAASPADASSLLNRLQTAATAFERRAAANPSDSIDHPAFGRLALVDFIRLQEIHTAHHRSQLTL